MKVVSNYRLDSEVKIAYGEFIQEEYGSKRNNCGSELSKWMKLGLAINGDEKYQDDPDVLALLEKANKKYNQIHQKKSKPDIEEINDGMEELIERKLEEKLDKIEKKIENRVRRESSKKHGHAEFKKQFQMAFNEHHQVSRNDLERFIMNNADIVDKRAVKSRIQYLLSHGMIQTFAPNVYNVKNSSSS